jgi:hypothetical protein
MFDHPLLQLAASFLQASRHFVFLTDWEVSQRWPWGPSHPSMPQGEVSRKTESFQPQLVYRQRHPSLHTLQEPLLFGTSKVFSQWLLLCDGDWQWSWISFTDHFFWALVGCASKTAMSSRWAAVPCWRGKWLIVLCFTKPVLGYLIGVSYNNEIKDDVYQLACCKPCCRIYRDPWDDQIKKVAASLLQVVSLSLCNIYHHDDHGFVHPRKWSDTRDCFSRAKS